MVNNFDQKEVIHRKTLCEKCPNKELSLVRTRAEYGDLRSKSS